MKTQINKNRVSRGNRNFEAMEERRLFAADLMFGGGLMESVATEVATVEVAQVETGGVGSSDQGKPNPEDDDNPGGPIGPVFREIVLAENIGSEILDQVKPNPEDDDNPGGPIGPVWQHAADFVLPGNPVEDLVEEIGQVKTMSLTGEGATEGKPEDIDCDGNPLTASCDFQAEVPEQEGKPDPDPDCEHPLAASCDYKAEDTEEESPDRPLRPDFDLLEIHDARKVGEETTEPEDTKPADYPGDADGDWDVDFADFLQVSNNYGKTGMTRAQGDLTGDGKVSFDDFLEVSHNYGNDRLAELREAIEAVFAVG